MSIVSYVEKSNTATVDTKGVRTYTRKYLVQMSALSDRPPSAWGGIPINRYDAYPTDSGAKAVSLNCDPEGDQLGWYTVTYTYTSAPFDQGNTTQDPTQTDQSVTPTSRPWVITYGAVHGTRIVGPKDLAGVDVVNSAGQPFSPPLEVPCSNLIFTVEAYKALAGFDPTAKQLHFQDAINDAGLLIAVTPAATTVWPAKTVRCNEYNVVSVTEQGVTCWKVTITLEVKITGWQPSVLDAGTVFAFDPGHPPQKIVDRVGNSHDSPIPLDGTGHPLNAGAALVYKTFNGGHETNGTKEGLRMQGTSSRLRLHQWQCPGDLTVMTMAIESLHRQYPGQFVTDVKTNHNELFAHNPHVTTLVGGDVRDVPMHCNSINESHIPHHFGESFCRTLGDALGLPLRLQTNRPHLYLSEAEQLRDVVREKTGHVGPYAVIVNGFKDDAPVKWAGTDLYQSVVDEHRGRITFVQIGAEPDKHHHHPRLSGVLDMVGKTSLRELLCVCSRAAFGIGGITSVGLIMAAWQKPYVCLIGGREPLSWIHYPTQISLNVLGLLPCCRTNACWRNTVTGSDAGKRCVLPVLDAGGDTVPACMAMLKTAAIDAVDVLIDDGTQDVKAITAGRTLVSEDRLRLIRDNVRAVQHLPGDMAELGCYRGGTSKLIAVTAPGKLLHIFDGFEIGIPEDDEEHIGHRAGEFANPLEDVRGFLAGHNVRLYPGRFPDTATGLDDVRLCFVHLDFDTYQSTRDALVWLWPKMVPGGVVLLDDYGWHRTPGVERAVAEVLPGVEVVRTNGMQAKLIKA